MSSPTGLGLQNVDSRGSLREQVTDALRSLVVTGRLKPGELYSAPALAAEFGVSATPVREAMLDLASEGLVEAVRNKGFRVTEMSDDLLDSLAELRAIIEVPVMAKVARECTGEVEAKVRALRPVAEQLVDRAAAADLEGYITLDIEFHLAFLALHGNRYVVDVVRDLRHRSRLYGLEAMSQRGALARSAAEHLEIVDAALARDGKAMERVMSHHIAQVRRAWAGRESEE